MKISDAVRKSLTPLIYVNAAAGAGAGLWIMAKGIWTPIWPAVLAFFLSPVIFPVLMIPAAFFAGMMMISDQSQKPRLSIGMQALSMTYLITLLTCYGMLAFHFMGKVLVEGHVTAGLVYAVASGVLPWVVFAARDRDNLMFSGLVLMMQAAAVSVAVVAGIFYIGYWKAFWLFWGLMAGMVGAQAVYEQKYLKKTTSGS